MSKQSFMCEAEEMVMKAATDFCQKYGKTFTEVLEAALTLYLDSHPEAGLNVVTEDVKVFLGDLRAPVS